MGKTPAPGSTNQTRAGQAAPTAPLDLLPLSSYRASVGASRDPYGAGPLSEKERGSRPQANESERQKS